MATSLHLFQRQQRQDIIASGYILCRACNERKELAAFSKDSRSGRYNARCKKCRYAVRGRGYYEQTRGTPQKKFDTYKNMAKSRGYEFTLRFADFMEFWRKPCSYCGDSIKTVGIDRIDNTIGYTVENCVPCCETCNKMKRMQTKEEFLERCQRIVMFCLCAGAS